MAYLLDANVLIEAHRRYYGMDFCPAFWRWLQERNQAGKVFSIEKVKQELLAGGDRLAKWAGRLGTRFFLEPNQAVLPCLAQVSHWVKGQNYAEAAVTAFLDEADFYLLAQALAHRHVVVTLEQPSDSRRRIKIPNVAIGLGIKCLTTFEMLRKERARFVLSTGERGSE